MANQETNVTNAAESTLSSSLSLGATTANVTDTSSFPAVNFYAVIDPDNDSKREVVLATAKTGTTLTLTRGQDGSSDVEHDSGAIIAVVPVAAHFTDINDRVEGHAHSGGTDGAAVATGDLTGHDKATHDALNIDADTVDGSEAADLLDRSNHTGTQAVSTLSDHNKAAHDSLGIDAATLDGNSPAAFAAVAGDTFTGAVTFDALATFAAGADVQLSDNAFGHNAPASSWPDGITTFRGTNSGGFTWPAAGGLVVTFKNAVSDGTVLQFYMTADTPPPVLMFRRWVTGTASWSDWQTVTTAQNPGLWEVDGHTSDASHTVTGSRTTAASVSLTIPSDWGSWKCYASARGSLNMGTGDVVTGYITIDGTDVEDAVLATSDDLFSVQMIGRRTGMTTTGSRSITFQVERSTGIGSTTIEDTVLYARAVRTS